MSWLFSQALVEAYSAGNCSDGEPCAQLNVMDTPHPFWRNVKTMDFSNLFLFGVTFAPLTADRGEALLMSYRAVFHARILAQPEKAQASTVSAPDCGRTWHALSTKYDLDTCSWKIHHCLFPEDLPESSVTLPKWGLMQNGELWERTTSALRISAIDAGLLPTPTATNAHQGLISKAGGTSKGKPLLPMAAMTWPTPTVNDSKNSTLPPSQIKHDNIPGALLRNGETPGGNLNPTWVEWLMGWPLGWTDLKPLEMDKCLWPQQWHGDC